MVPVVNDKISKLSGMTEPDDITVLLMAHTGVATFNINAFHIPVGMYYCGFQPLSHDRHNKLGVCTVLFSINGLCTHA